MEGKLYVIGIGPGDPELLTLKAVRLIKETPVICVPKGREEGSSLALSIVERTIDLSKKEIVQAHFPMRKTRGSTDATKGEGDEEREASGSSGLDAKWNETVDAISGRVSDGKDVAFLTLGDPSIYSTFFYLYDRLLEKSPGLNIEIIPGVSSINASAARARISLGLADDRIAVLPANYMGQLRSVLDSFDTVVLMKVNKVFGEITALLADMKLLDKAVCVERAGMADERIITDLRAVQKDALNYFSMVIVKK